MASLFGEKNNGAKAQLTAASKVVHSTVSGDLHHSREQAMRNTKHYIEEKLPLEFGKCLIALKALH